MNHFPTERAIREADARRDAATDDRATGDSGPSFHELWARELDERAERAAKREELSRAVVRSAMRGFRLLDNRMLLAMAKAPISISRACARLEIFLRGEK